MTDVSFCEDGVGMERERLFYLLRNELASPAPPPVLPVYPSGGHPSPQHTRTDCKAQAAVQAVPDARQTTQDTARRVDQDDGGLEGISSKCCTRNVFVCLYV